MAAFTLTVKYLGGEPAGEGSFLDRVGRAFADGTIPHRAVRDLARYEAEVARLTDAPALRATSEPMPPDETPLALSRSVGLVMYGADLPRMLVDLRAGREARPRPCRGWILLVATGGGVEESELDGEGGWMFEMFREPSTLKKAVAMWEERGPFEALWERGVLVRA